MKFEKVKSKRKTTLLIVLLVLIGATVVLATSLAAYKTTKDFVLASGNINYVIPDMNIVAIYQQKEDGDYASVTSIPTSGYIFNSSNSKCYVDDLPQENVSIAFDGTNLNVTGVNQKGTKCYVYFDSISEANTINISDIINNADDISECSPYGTAADTTKSLCTTSDDDGITYFYYNKPTDNFINFAGYNWRIVRINGDGSLRIMLNESIGVVCEDDPTDVGELVEQSLYNFKYNYLEHYLSYIVSAKSNSNNPVFGDIEHEYHNVTGNGEEIAEYSGTVIVSANNKELQNRIFNDEPSLTYEHKYSADVTLITIDEILFAKKRGYLTDYSLMFTNDLYKISNIITYDSCLNGYEPKFDIYFGYYIDGCIGTPDSEVIGHEISRYTNKLGVSKCGNLHPVVSLNKNTLLAGSGTQTDPYVVVGLQNS